jgi:nicotinamidase/pyrazinamidase
MTSTRHEAGYDTRSNCWGPLVLQGVDTVYLVGVATDYCVKYSALDAVADGFKTYVITDAVRGVDAEPGDIQKALDEMASKGVKLVTSAEVLGSKPVST